MTTTTIFLTNTNDIQTPKFEISNSFKALAGHAGLTEVFWKPYNHNHFFAGSIIPPLEEGLNSMYEDPVSFKKFENPNASVIAFIDICEKLLDVCYKNKSAQLSSRINFSNK
jgi:hypothetical protein